MKFFKIRQGLQFCVTPSIICVETVKLRSLKKGLFFDHVTINKNVDQIQFSALGTYHFHEHWLQFL